MTEPKVRRWVPGMALFSLTSLGLLAANLGSWFAPVNLGATLNTTSAEQ